MALAMRVFSFNHIEVRNPLTALSHITAIYHLREIIQYQSYSFSLVIKKIAFLSIFVIVFLFLLSLSICSFELVGYIISCGIC